jgi:2-keto-4-pentenoate hydratase
VAGRRAHQPGPQDRPYRPPGEAEILVDLSGELQPGSRADEIAASVGWAALGVEIVDCHYSGWSVTPLTSLLTSAPTPF